MSANANSGAVVAVVAPRYPPDVGGLENYARWMALTLRDAGHDVVVITTHPGRGRRDDVVDDIRVIRLGIWVTLSNTPVNGLWLWQLRRLFRRLGVTHIATHAPVPGLADAATLVAGSRPVIATYHSGSMVKGDGGPIDALLRAYERHVLPRIFGRARHLVAVSPVALTAKAGPHVTITPGVDTGLFTPPAGDAVRAPEVLFAGRIESTSRWKGLQVLIDAIALMVERGIDVRLVIAGDGDDVPALEQRAQDAGVAGHLRWVGRVDQPALAELMRTVSATVLPSLTESESFGMTLIEAMACACPVIGSDIGGISYVVRERVDGLIVPPGEPEELALAVAEILADPDWAATLGAAGRQAALERWDWARQRETLLGLID